MCVFEKKKNGGEPDFEKGCPTMQAVIQNVILSRKEAEMAVENTNVQAEQPLTISESDLTTHKPQPPEEQQHRTE